MKHQEVAIKSGINNSTTTAVAPGYLCKPLGWNNNVSSASSEAAGAATVQQGGRKTTFMSSAHDFSLYCIFLPQFQEKKKSFS